MGFSPGTFKDTNNQEFHWEANSIGLLLWDKHEKTLLLSLSAKQAVEAYFQLYTALSTLPGVSKDLISFR